MIIGPYSNVQYRPPSTLETATDDPLSVRVFGDLAVAANNFKYHVSAPMRGIICFPLWESRDNTTTEHVIQQFGPMRIAEGFSKIQWDINSWISTGNGVTTFRLYGSTLFYKGDAGTFNINQLYTYTNETFIIQDKVAKWNSGTDVECNPDYFASRMYFCLTAQNSDVTTRAKVSAMRFMPVMV